MIDDLHQLPWSHAVVALASDATEAGQLIPELSVIGLDDPNLGAVLPSGPGSCVLVLGAAPLRAAAALRALGVDQIYGRDLPPGYLLLTQFLEEKARAVQYFGGSEHLREVLDLWTAGAYRIDVRPEPHADLKRPPRLQGRPFLELLEMPIPKTLIRGVLAEQAVAVLGGPSGSFKSFTVLDWHLSVFFGVSWQNRRVRPGCSVYFCGEGQAYAGRRCKAWLQHNAARIAGIDTSGRRFEIVGEVPRLTQPGGVAELRDYLRDFVKRHGSVSLVTIDTLSVGLSGDDDENSNATMGAVVSELGRIRTEFGCTIVLVHHLRKDAGQGGAPAGKGALRGGVALSCNVDQVFMVAANKGEQMVWLDKNKDGEDHIEIGRSAFQVITLGTDDEGYPITSGVLVPVISDDDAKREARIAQLVDHYRRTFGSSEFAQTTAEQMKPAGMARAEARALLEVARETGQIRWRLVGKTVMHTVPGGAE